MTSSQSSQDDDKQPGKALFASIALAAVGLAGVYNILTSPADCRTAFRATSAQANNVNGPSNSLCAARQRVTQGVNRAVERAASAVHLGR